jgi:hypothetical protein
MAVSFKFKFKNASEAIKALKEHFSVSSDVELDVALGSLSTQDIIDSLSQDPRFEGLVDSMESLVSSNPQSNFIGGQPVDADDINIIELCKKLQFEVAPIVNPVVSGTPTDFCISSTGRRVEKRHVATKGNPSTIKRLNVKVTEIRILSGEQYRVRDRKSAESFCQQVSIVFETPSGEVNSMLTNENYCKSLAETGTISQLNGKFIPGSNPYLAVNVVHNTTTSTYADSDPTVVAFAKRFNGSIVNRGGVESAVLFYDSDSIVFKSFIGTTSVETFEDDKSLAREGQRQAKATDEAIRLKQAEALAALQAKLEFMQMVEVYATQHNITVERAVEKLKLFADL